MIRIQRDADLVDMFGGQTFFEVAVAYYLDDEFIDYIGAGHTVPEAVADARETMRGWWHANDCDVCGEPNCTTCADPYERDGDGLDEVTP